MFVDINTTTTFDEIEKTSAKISSNISQSQQTAAAATAASKNQGSRSTVTFTALPFKARYQRVTKKRPRSSAINTMCMLNSVYFYNYYYYYHTN